MRKNYFGHYWEVFSPKDTIKSMQKSLTINVLQKRII